MRRNGATKTRGVYYFCVLRGGDLDFSLSDSDHGYDGDDEYKGEYDVWDDETTGDKGSTTAPTRPRLSLAL